LSADGCARIGDRRFDLPQPSLARQIGEIRTQDSSAAAHHVAVGTLSLPREECFSRGGIAVDGDVRGRRTQHGEMGNDRVDLGGGEGKGRHAGVGNAVADQISKLLG
jgi:hypothetical protein